MRYIVRDIERAVCQRFKLTPERLRGAERQRKIARPRQIAMYLARELTDASLPQIGRHFARDHTTVIHACKKIAAMAEQGGRMPTYLAEVRAILEALTPVKDAIASSVAATSCVSWPANAGHPGGANAISPDQSPAECPERKRRAGER